MCGRFANHLQHLKDWSEILGSWPTEVSRRYNVAPTQTVAAFVEDGGRAMRWGLIAPWAKEISSRYATFNARLESVAEKPAFRHAWRSSQRCLIPALGYYEWRGEKADKQPYFVHLESGQPMVFAGLYEPAREGGFPASCTILTRPARGTLEALHPRTPAMLAPEQASAWFGESPDDVLRLLEEQAPPAAGFYPVDRAVNNARYDAPDCIDPLE